MGFPNFFTAFVSKAPHVLPLTKEIVSERNTGRMPYSQEELEEVAQRAINGYHLPLEYLLEHIGRYAHTRELIKQIGKKELGAEEWESAFSGSYNSEYYRKVGAHLFSWMSGQLRRHVCASETNKIWLRSSSEQKKQTAIQGVFLTIFDEIGQPVSPELTTMIIAMTSLTLQVGFDLRIY